MSNIVTVVDGNAAVTSAQYQAIIAFAQAQNAEILIYTTFGYMVVDGTTVDAYLGQDNQGTQAEATAKSIATDVAAVYGTAAKVQLIAGTVTMTAGNTTMGSIAAGDSATIIGNADKSAI